MLRLLFIPIPFFPPIGDRGFEIFWDSSDQTPITSKVSARVVPRISTDSVLYRVLRRLLRRFEASVGIAHYASAEKVTDMASGWLQQESGPFLLWLHYMDMHYPYAPPEDLLRQLRPRGIGKRQRADLLVRSIESPGTLNEDDVQMLQDLYDAGLLHVDQQIGRLLDALATRGGSQDTIVILTSDHGEEFLEHGAFGHAAMVHVPDEKRTRIRLYDELLHVPLIIWEPRTLGPHTVTDLVSLVDIPPTLVDLVGLPAPDVWQGQSLTPLLAGKRVPLHDGVFAEYTVRNEGIGYPVVAYRTNRWKYIYDGFSADHELYDLEQDPVEQVNLYRPDHPAVADLQEAVWQHLQAAKGVSFPEAIMDPEVVERLIGLGYLE